MVRAQEFEPWTDGLKVPCNAGWTMRKVPELTAYFWIIKVLPTAVGESITDYLVHHIPPVIAVALGTTGLAISLVLQFSARQYVPWIY